MSRRTHVLIAAAIALTCVNCSLLLYNDDELSGGAASSPAADASSDTATSDAALADVSAGSDAGADADARSIPDSAVVFPVNGHAYEVVVMPNVDWYAAKQAAAQRGGHLATIQDAEENSFIYSVAEPIDKAWKLITGDGVLLGPWIGCIQKAGSQEPSGGFEWVTGEPFTYANFRSGQPDNSARENACHFYAGSERGPTWNDEVDLDPLDAFVVEYE